MSADKQIYFRSIQSFYSVLPNHQSCHPRWVKFSLCNRPLCSAGSPRLCLPQLPGLDPGMAFCLGKIMLRTGKNFHSGIEIVYISCPNIHKMGLWTATMKSFIWTLICRKNIISIFISLFFYNVEAWAKWLTFTRRSCQTHFVNEKWVSRVKF